MIKTNGYSIGNYITYLDELYVINGITYEELNPDKWRIHFRTLNGSSSNTKSLSWIKPIPLTPEWLERCGFEFAPSVGYYVYELPNKPQGIDSIKVGSGVFLHQLQNLYFALTGEELQIKMP
jgi:hypothetical protein